MKKQILINLIIISSSLTMNAQWNGANPVWITSNVGIGTTTPNEKLEINGNLKFINNGSKIFLGTNDYIQFTDGNSDGFKFIYDDLERLRITNNGNIGIGTTTPNEKLEINGNLKFINNGSKIFLGTNDYIQFTDGNGDGFKFIYDDLERLRITNTGNIGIGTTTPQYKLDVCGTIRAKEVKVDLLGTCIPDFVFKKNYKLMNLNELEKFVTAKQHLPEIASEKEMIENGLNMKEFQMKLLQKMEEMTLYIIEQNKKNEKQEQELKLLKAKIKKIESIKR